MNPDEALDPYDYYLVRREDDCGCSHPFSMHTSHGCLSCDCGVEVLYGWANADRLQLPGATRTTDGRRT